LEKEFHEKTTTLGKSSRDAIEKLKQGRHKFILYPHLFVLEKKSSSTKILPSSSSLKKSSQSQSQSQQKRKLPVDSAASRSRLESKITKILSGKK
jgi:hypothetical protein